MENNMGKGQDSQKKPMERAQISTVSFKIFFAKADE